MMGLTMKKLFVWALCVAFNVNAFAQELNAEQPLPQDESIKKGVLDNGMTQMRVASYVREILVGLIVIAAVAVSSISKANR